MKLIVVLQLLVFGLYHQSKALVSPPAKTILFFLGTDTFGSPYWTNEFLHALNHKGYKLYVATSVIFDEEQLPGVEFIHLKRRHVTMPLVEEVSFYNRIHQTTFWYLMHSDICNAILQSPGIRELVKLSKRIGNKVDLIIFDASHGPSCLLAFAQLFPRAPIVGLSPVPASFEELTVAGRLYIPFNEPHFTTGYSPNMTFSERADNALAYGWAIIRRRGSWFRQRSLLSNLVHLGFFRDLDVKFVPDWQEQLKRVRLVLVNSHISMDHAQLLPPNVIEVGGLHFGVTRRLLLDDIQRFMDNSRNGFFLISQGQLDDAFALGIERHQIIMRAVRNTPEYDFIWVIGHEHMPRGQSDNLFVLDVLSDNEILAHPKVKGFITDGSHMSMQAAVYFGVPMIIIPIKMYHFTNAARAVAMGYAIQLNLKKFTADGLKNATTALINTQRYARVVKRRQFMFRNRPQKPMDVALWWIENLIEYPSQTDYFSSPKASKSSYIEEHNWDVEAFFAGFVLFNLIVLADTLGLLRVISYCRNKIKLYFQVFLVYIYAGIVYLWHYAKSQIYGLFSDTEEARSSISPRTVSVPRRVANRPKQKTKKRH